MEQNTQDSKASRASIFIIWGAMLAACFIYGIIFARLQAEQSEILSALSEEELALSAPSPVIGYVMLALALVNIPLGFFIPPLLYRRLKARPIEKLQTIMIVRCAFFDAISILGLMAGILDALPISICYGLITTGAVCIAMMFPSLLSSLERIDRELAQSSRPL